MFEQAFKNIDDVLWKEAGCTTELDYTEQTSWLLFLKYLENLERERATEAALVNKKYTPILIREYRWENWAAPRDKDGKLDHNKGMVGDDLVNFVDTKLFPYLHKFKQKASGPNTIEYKIGEIFGYGSRHAHLDNPSTLSRKVDLDWLSCGNQGGTHGPRPQSVSHSDLRARCA